MKIKRKSARVRPAKDLKTMPKGYCPGVLHVYRCEILDKTFEIGRLISLCGKVVFLYPFGNYLALETARVMRKEFQGSNKGIGSW